MEQLCLAFESFSLWVLAEGFLHWSYCIILIVYQYALRFREYEWARHLILGGRGLFLLKFFLRGRGDCNIHIFQIIFGMLTHTTCTNLHVLLNNSSVSFSNIPLDMFLFFKNFFLWYVGLTITIFWSWQLLFYLKFVIWASLSIFFMHLIILFLLE